MIKALLNLELILLFICCLAIPIQSILAVDRNVSSQSAYYYATGGARVAETDDSDTAYLNPAGTVFMEDGITIDLSLHRSQPIQEIHHKTFGNYYNNAPAIYPTGSVTYKEDKLAVFLKIEMLGATGGLFMNRYPSLDYMANMFSLPGQTVVAVNQNFEAGAMMGGPCLGAAIKIGDSLSVSYAYNYLIWFNFVKANADMVTLETGSSQKRVLNQKVNGSGIGHSLGFNYKVNKSLHLAMRYNYQVNFKGELTVSDSDNLSELYGSADGDAAKDVLPAVAQFGLAYDISDSLVFDWALGYCFEEGLRYNGVPKGISKTYENSYETNAAITYQASDSLRLMTGARIGANTGRRTFSYGNFLTGFYALGAGMAYEISPINTTVALGYLHYFFDDFKTDKDQSGRINMSQEVRAIGLTLDIKV